MVKLHFNPEKEMNGKNITSKTSKKKVLDLRNHDDVFLRNRSSIKTKDAVATPISSDNSSNNTNSSPGFFGGMFSSDNSSSSNVTSLTETKLDFLGNPVDMGNNTSTSQNNSSSPYSSYSDTSNTNLNVTSNNDLLYKLSRLTDRLELIEKKLARLDRKLGITEES